MTFEAPTIRSQGLFPLPASYHDPLQKEAGSMPQLASSAQTALPISLSKPFPYPLRTSEKPL